MKLGIVIPLKSKKVAKNWDVTCANIKATVSSILLQSSQEFSVVIVGHEKPEFLENILDDVSNLYFQELSELDPPIVTLNKTENQISYEKDRCSKILKGIVFLRKIEKISHWFPLDADDLIHKNLVKTLSESKRFDAIIINRGYVYYKLNNILNLENNFSSYCGSSAILSDKLISINLFDSDRDSRNFIFDQISHVHMRQELEKRKLKISVPRKRLVAYCRDNGENISAETRPKNSFYLLKRKFKIYAKKIIFDDAIRKNFGL